MTGCVHRHDLNVRRSANRFPSPREIQCPSMNRRDFHPIAGSVLSAEPMEASVVCRPAWPAAPADTGTHKLGPRSVKHIELG